MIRRMPDDGRHPDRRLPKEQVDPVSADAFISRLDDGLTAPDMTRAIMGRLGYMRAAPSARRRHRLQRWGSRAGIVLAAAFALTIGFRALQAGNEVRRPAGPTIPAAIQRDLQQQQDNFGSTIQMIRGLQPRMAPSAAPGAGEPTPQLKDDVNRTSSLMRWV